MRLEFDLMSLMKGDVSAIYENDDAGDGASVDECFFFF